MKRPISSEMTPAPTVISTIDRVTAAYERMRACRAHHLPVVRNGSVVGIVTEHDLDLCASLHPDPDEVLVAQAMRTDVYVVAPETPLVEVLQEMNDRAVDSAVIVAGDHVVGIFTARDAMRVLSWMLSEPARTGVSRAS